jgi:hypothetical protein
LRESQQERAERELRVNAKRDTRQVERETRESRERQVEREREKRRETRDKTTRDKTSYFFGPMVMHVAACPLHSATFFGWTRQELLLQGHLLHNNNALNKLAGCFPTIGNQFWDNILTSP